MSHDLSLISFLRGFRALAAAAMQFARFRRKKAIGAPGAAPGGFPVEAYGLALDRLVEVAHAAGTAEERARIASIMNLPNAGRFAATAWILAENGNQTREGAEKALAVIADAQAPHPMLTNEPAPEGAVLH